MHLQKFNMCQCDQCSDKLKFTLHSVWAHLCPELQYICRYISVSCLCVTNTNIQYSNNILYLYSLQCQWGSSHIVTSWFWFSYRKRNEKEINGRKKGLRHKSYHLTLTQISCVVLCLGRLLGRHCGSTLPASMDTSDSFAYVRFVSDASGNAAGFSLSFEASVEGTIIFKKIIRTGLFV